MSNLLDQITMESKKLPTMSGAINWDQVAENYFEYILSPYAPEMIEGYEVGHSRNLLLNYIHSLSNDVTNLRVLDMGCGPGNLIPYLPSQMNRLYGLDISKTAIAIAQQKACEYEIEFSAIYRDVLEYFDDGYFDLIISSNSILPDSREEVVSIFSKLANLLSHDGKLMAILPSFDTTLYLQALREKYHQDEIEDVVMNRQILAYADDGFHLQCYHTKASIINETHSSGLKLFSLPEKVYYPWSLCRKFGYGYYPQADEEIWDWFIVAEKAAL